MPELLNGDRIEALGSIITMDHVMVIITAMGARRSGSNAR